jgi:hypothetical protein
MVARRMIALSAAWRWISVSITSGASRVNAPSPWIGGNCPRIPEHRDRLAEAHQVARHLLADHGDLVEHDQSGVRCIVSRVEREAQPFHLRHTHCATVALLVRGEQDVQGGRRAGDEGAARRPRARRA